MLLKKCLREIKINKSQFINIFIMVFLGVFVFTGIHAYMDGMEKSANDYYEKNNLQDLWVSGENFTKQDLEDIKNIENVKDAERILTLNMELEEHKDVILETNFIETNNISKMYVVEGENFEKNKEGIWFDSYLAKSLGIKVGDEISVKYKNYKITQKVVGLVNTPDHVYFVKDSTEIYPTHNDYGFIYLSINSFPKEYIYNELKSKIISENSMISEQNITNEMIENMIPNFNLENYYVFNSIIVDVDDIEKINQTTVDIENTIKSAIAVTNRDSSPSVEVYNSEVEEGDTYSGVFTFLFLFIALLSVVTTMNRFVKKQRTQIGTLKALGFKTSKITLHYISYGFVISLISSALGVIAGKYILGRPFIEMEMTYFEIPVYNTEIKPLVYVLAVMVVLLVTFVTYLSCRKILKEPASQALRVEIPKVKNTNFDITTKGILKKASISIKWNIRDVFRNKGRSIMAVVGVTGCTMLLVCAFGLLDTMNSYLDWEFEKINNFKYKLSLQNNYSEEQYEEITQKYGNATTQTLGIELKNGDKKETNVIVINDAKEYVKYTNHNKDYINLSDDGIYITEKLSDKYSLKIGDEITWHAFGDNNWYTSKIVGLNRDPQNQQINATRSYYESLGLNYKPDAVYTNKDLSEVNEISGVDKIQSVGNIRSGMESMLGVMKTMVVLLIVVSAVLSFVIIYNLGTLSFSEKQYQFATLKVLGFKDKQIKNIFVKQNIWLAVTGIILGLPLGFSMISYIFGSALGENYDFNAEVSIVSYLFAIVGSYVVAILVNKWLSRKVKSIDMVSSLKANE